MTDTQRLLTTAFPQESFELDKPLAPLTYFKIGGPAEAFLKITSEDQLNKIIQYTTANNIRITILGGASNVLVSDKGVSGLVLQITANEVSNTDQTVGGKTIVTAQAGVKTALLVSQTVQLGFTGLEFFLGVPGTLGGAVYNNAHYLHELIDSYIHRVYAIARDGTSRWYSHEECEFAYEHSRFQHSKEVIWLVEFALEPGNKAASQELIKEATQYRANTQPLGIPSSGCIFQNVPNTPELRSQFPQFAKKSHVPGGFLIDQAGLKNTRQGNIVVSEKHAAWMINEGAGTAEDVKALIAQVKKTVAEKFGVELQEEVFFLE